MSNKVKLNKNGRPIGWHGQSWVYFKGMMMVAFEDKGVDEYVMGKKKITGQSTDVEKKAYNDAQIKIKQIILSSLSMELGQRVMLKTKGTDMWEDLVTFYEGKTNDATKTNQEIILFHKLQTTRCKPNWDVAQHLDNMYMLQDQLKAIGAGVREPIFIQMLMKSLPANPRFDRLKGMVESGDDKVDTPDKLKDQVLRMDSFNKCDREMGRIGGNAGQAQGQGQEQKPKGQQGPSRSGYANNGIKQQSPEKAAAIAALKVDRKQGNCFLCHKSGHQKSECPERNRKTSGQKQATCTVRVSNDMPPESEVVPAGTDRRNGDISENVDEISPNHDGIQYHVSKEHQPREQEGYSHDDDEQHVHSAWDWCFDNASNVHVASDLRYFTEYKPFADHEDTETVHGFQKNFTTTPVGRGTVQLIVNKGALDIALTLRDVYYVPDGMNLMSHSQAEDQGYVVEYRGRTNIKVYEIWQGDQKVLEVGRNSCGIFMFTARNAFLPQDVSLSAAGEQSGLQVNQTMADGVADLQRLHERLGHLCPRCVKLMADNGLVTGMTLRQRLFADCEACHMGKERKPSPAKHLERGITEKNQVIFADLLFPYRSSSTNAYKAVLVIVDGFSRYTTVYPLRSKTADEVNAAMQRYIVWAERQFSGCPVRQVITDNGGEFENEEMQNWYREQGIAFLPNPPRSSHLNLCERAHQTIVHMMKTLLATAGLPKTFWMHALEMATFLRNRTYCAAVKDTPYHLMIGERPDLHRIKLWSQRQLYAMPTFALQCFRACIHLEQLQKSQYPAKSPLDSHVNHRHTVPPPTSAHSLWMLLA